MKRKAILAGAAAVAAMAVLLLGAWALGWFSHSPYSSDPAVAELEKLRDEGLARMGETSQQQREAGREQFQQRMEGLTDQQRREFFESSMPVFVKMFARDVDRFLALPPDEQRAELDRRIDQMQARGGPPGQPGTSPPDPQRMDQIRKQALDWTTPEERAKFDAYFSKLRDRMEERGIAPPPGGGPF